MNQKFHSKYALIIAINYLSNHSLDGCHNDAIQIRNLLVNKLNFKTKNITILMDNNSYPSPTYSNIIKYIGYLSKKPKGDYWFSFHGHGIKNNRNLSSIVPIDHEKYGYIDSLTINKNLVTPLLKKGNLYTLFDCCYSMRMVLLPFTYFRGNLTNSSNLKKSKYQVINLSASLNHQKSQDIYVSKYRKDMGVLTFVFLKILEEFNYQITIRQLINSINDYLVINNIPQVPNISFNKNPILDQMYFGNNKKDVYDKPNCLFLMEGGKNCFKNTSFNIVKTGRKILSRDKLFHLPNEKSKLHIHLKPGSYQIVFNQIRGTVKITIYDKNRLLHKFQFSPKTKVQKFEI